MPLTRPASASVGLAVRAGSGARPTAYARAVSNAVDTRGTGSETGQPVGTDLSSSEELDLGLHEDGPASTTGVQL